MARRSSQQVTIREVAARAGVSFKSVSNVINDRPYVSEELRLKVRQVIAELGYRPHAAARSLASHRSNSLGLVLRAAPADAHTDPFLSQFLLGACDVAGAEGFGMLVRILLADEPIRRYANIFDHRQVDGLIVLCPRIDDAPSAEEEHDLPVVRIGRAAPGSNALTVDADDEHGAYGAVSHLIALGHRRIGMVANADPSYTVTITRVQGYRKALAAHDIPCEDQLLTAGHFSRQSGQEAMERLLNLPKPPSAVFVSSDLMALGAMQAIRDRGLHIPNEIAIVGYDDLFLSAFTNPPLTSVRVPIDTISTHATRMLIQAIQGGRVEPRQVILPTELVVRGSCGFQAGRRWSPVPG